MPTSGRSGGTAGGCSGSATGAQLWNNYDKGAAGVFDGTVGVVTVVIPLTTSSWMMLQRNLLYTWVTRARKPVVLAGWPCSDHVSTAVSELVLSGHG